MHRAEIDGLRAVAVIAVILYHAGFERFSGGFVGVDVFFVISGYLITTIILSEFEGGKFSVVNFYERRARRILPALFVVLFFTIVFSWFNFLPSEFKVFGQGVTASILFAANIYLYEKGNDYFGLQSEQNPILHLWSLAVEEQYYLFFPIFILIAWKIWGRNVWVLIILAAGASLGFAHFQVGRDPSAVFFLLPSRAWEILVGSALAFVSKKSFDLDGARNLKSLLSAIGFLMIAFSVLYFDKNTPFPSAWALLPVMGAALIIAFADERNVVGLFLGSKFAVAIGLISFSLYLWHQPFFAFYRVFFGEEVNERGFLLLILASFLLSYITWRFVERPFRDKSKIGRVRIFALALVFSGLFALFGVVGHLNNGYPQRNEIFSRLASNYGLSLKCNGNYQLSQICSTSATPKTAIFGNSYAMHLVEGYRAVYPKMGFVQLTQDSCAPHLGDTRSRAGKMMCSEFVEKAIGTIVHTPSIQNVIISSPFRDILDDKMLYAFDGVIRRLKDSGKKVFVVGPPPSTGIDFGKCFVRNASGNSLGVCDFDRASIPKYHFSIVDKLKLLVEKDGAEFFDITDIICDEVKCHASIDGIFIYRDTGHLSREGSRLIFESLRRSASASLPSD